MTPVLVRPVIDPRMSTMGSFEAVDTWTRTGRHLVHALLSHRVPLGGLLPDASCAVFVPGLGLPQYLRPTVDHLTECGVFCVVLDLPGFLARGRHGCPPDVDALGTAVADWVTAHRIPGPLSLMGHSTGAQAALAAAIQLQDSVSRLALVMAGPTFRPEHRKLLRLTAAVPPAYRRESLGELVQTTTLLRNAVGVASVVKSGMRDAPERRLAQLRVPLALTAGEADTFAPERWLRSLAASAGTTATTVRVLPGSHNNPFTYPVELGDLIMEAVAEVV
jgi:pimeloyl-ACP methyl ester carboxylesterase